jgi:hypothetical protein
MTCAGGIGFVRGAAISLLPEPLLLQGTHRCRFQVVGDPFQIAYRSREWPRPISCEEPRTWPAQISLSTASAKLGSQCGVEPRAIKRASGFRRPDNSQSYLGRALWPQQSRGTPGHGILSGPVSVSAGPALSRFQWPAPESALLPLLQKSSFPEGNCSINRYF